MQEQKKLTIIAENKGNIAKIKIKEGQRILKGQVIALINAEALESQLITAKASLAKAKKDVERDGNLLAAGAISQTQFEEIDLSMKNQIANVTSLQQK